ncbi:Wadjet anti-phage system protein JetD domain-containing protein, partial [Thalassospira xiamenensis]
TRLRAGSVIPCPAFGEVPAPNLAEALEKTPLFYWGDLDLEGLRIYESMKKHFPKLKLSRAYELMANCLREPRRSHPYGALSGKSGHKPPKGNDPEVAHLATLCKDRAVDQEAICDPWPGNLVIQPYIFEDS